MSHPILTGERMKRWVESKAAGKHHVFRMRYVCPHCDLVWYQDITEEPEVFKDGGIPDPRTMGRGLLCGACEGRSRLVVGSAAQSAGPTVYALSQREIDSAVSRIHQNRNFRWISTEPMGVFVEKQTKLKDDKPAAIREICSYQDGDRRIRKCGITSSDAWAKGWIKNENDAPKQKPGKKGL
jgi:hypothetical protein